MKERLLKLFLFLSGIIFLPANVLALTPEEAALRSLDPTVANVNKQGTIFELIDDVMNRLPYFLGGLAFLALLISGAIYVSSLGDPTRMEVAKKNLTWTVIGILAASTVFIAIKVILWVTNPLQLG